MAYVLYSTQLPKEIVEVIREHDQRHRWMDTYSKHVVRRIPSKVGRRKTISWVKEAVSFTLSNGGFCTSFDKVRYGSEIVERILFMKRGCKIFTYSYNTRVHGSKRLYKEIRRILRHMEQIKSLSLSHW